MSRRSCVGSYFTTGSVHPTSNIQRPISNIHYRIRSPSLSVSISSPPNHSTRHPKPDTNTKTRTTQHPTKTPAPRSNPTQGPYGLNLLAPNLLSSSSAVVPPGVPTSGVTGPLATAPPALPRWGVWGIVPMTSAAGAAFGLALGFVFIFGGAVGFLAAERVRRRRPEA